MLFLALWFGAGALLAPFSYGMTFAHFQRKWPILAAEDYAQDMRFALVFAAMTLLVPITFLVPLVMGSGYGLKFR